MNKKREAEPFFQEEPGNAAPEYLPPILKEKKKPGVKLT